MRLSVCVRVHMCVRVCAYMYISLSLSLSLYVCIYMSTRIMCLTHNTHFERKCSERRIASSSSASGEYISDTL